MSKTRAAVVLLAAGEGRRVGAATNKVLLPLAGVPVFAWSLRWIAASEHVVRRVVVVREPDREAVLAAIDRHLPGLAVTMVAGGATRHGSEWNAFRAIAEPIRAGEIDVVAVHDAARPLAGAGLLDRVIEAAAEHGGALPVRDLAAVVPRDPVAPGRARPASAPAGGEEAVRLVAVQTPQAFRARALLEAYARAERDGFLGTDTASCLERYSDVATWCVPGDATNLKVTFPEDVALAARLLERIEPALREASGSWRGDARDSENARS